MSKVAIVVLTDTAGGEALGRVVNALNAAKEFKDGGDDVTVAFSGAGTKWIGELAQPDHKLNAVYRDLKGNIAGACAFCADAFDATSAARSEGVRLLEDYGPNMSYRQLIQQGYHVLTF